MYIFCFFSLSPEVMLSAGFGVKWGKVSFQHLGGGMWARSFRQDVIVPPGNGTFLIKISRQILVYVWNVAVLVKRVSGCPQRKEGKGDRLFWGSQGFGLVWKWGSINLVGSASLPAGCLLTWTLNPMWGKLWFSLAGVCQCHVYISV